MEATQVAKQVIGFQKTIFDNSYNTLSVVQEQAESMINNFVEQFPWVPDDGKKQMGETFAFSKKARDDFKKAIDDGYTRLEKLLDQK